MLTNITQVLVEQKLDALFNSANYTGCTCTQCKEDIMAIVLNKLPPHYVSTDKGALFERANQHNQRFDNELLPHLIRAAQLVEASPRHNIQK